MHDIKPVDLQSSCRHSLCTSHCAICMLNNVFSKNESVSTMLQSPKLSLSNAKSSVDALSALLIAQRNDERPRELWLEINTDALNIGIDQPVLPRTRNLRFLEGLMATRLDTY